MNIINDKKKLASVGVVVLALVGGGGAFAASKLTHGGHGTTGAGLRGGYGRPMQGGDDLAAAATYLGISQSTLQSDLQSGKTLADVAKATSGKTVDGLIAAIVASDEKSIESRVTAEVNGTFPQGPLGGGGGGGGDGGGPPAGSSGTVTGPHI
jgi:hypothetical protein